MPTIDDLIDLLGKATAKMTQLQQRVVALENANREMERRLLALEQRSVVRPPPPPPAEVDPFQGLLTKLKAAMVKRGIPPGKKEIVIWDNGMEQMPVVILGKGTRHHRVLFPEPQCFDGEMFEDHTVLVSQLRPMSR